MKDFIHDIDQNQFETLKNMLLSPDLDDINMAVDIMNLCNVKKKENFDFLCELIKNTRCPVTFDVNEDDWKNNRWNSFKFYSIADFTKKYDK
jgi:hypothetical protein